MTSSIRIFIGEPSSIDPAQGFEHDGALVLRFLADPLIDFTPDTGEPRPAAAASWEVDEDGKRVLFRLRRDVRFHHGRAVTAEDYVYSLTRVVRPETGSKLAYNLAMVEGCEAVLAGRSDTLSGVRALAPDLLEVRLTEPFHEIAAVFGHRVTAPVPAELIEADPEDFRVRPVSTGPYRIAEPWREGIGLVLERFDGYYGSNAAYPDGGGGHVDRIDLAVYDEVDEGYADWQRGALQITKVPPARLGDAFGFGERFRRTPCALMQYIGFPTRVAPFDDPRVRRAVAMSVDRQHIIDEIFHGTRPIADRVLPPAIARGDGGDDLIDIEYSPQRARELLAEAGVGTDLEFDFCFNAGLGHDAWVALALDQISAALGWRFRLTPLPWPEFLRWLPRADALFRMTWVIDYPSPDNFLYPLFHSESIHHDNFTGFSSAEFDLLIQRARSTADPAERAKLYRAAEEVVCSALPLLPLWFGVQYHLVDLDRFDIDGPPVDLFGEPALRLYRPRPSSAG
ncbi:oligopeptide transport system substrate-binding protein [Amycolatopsis sulphurea]|uniref:Oligopeptide transport system substrate-binding protein n=1 Tax=Amycolatopsis sulphurea TaxID=76022 RepID=A0A2A9G0S0_9PSEU|nr:ABC transporter substrate-binding protein [Amycolatopsis sulphurea]PFG57244.1 oligopeptide transport system substrate-binding protein [Amycolatopsis sulphurea]